MSENVNIIETPENKKGTVIQAVKAIAVLVVICLVCCLLLSICNDLFYVSDDEKFNRALAKIYPGDFTVAEKPALDTEYAANATYGEIIGVYKSTAGDYILQSKGIGGFNGGSVTLYVAVNAKEATIVGWSIESNEGQSFIGNITAKQQKTWYVGKRVDESLELSGEVKLTGTSMSSTAINNAINMAAYYCMNVLHIGANPEGDAKDAATQLLASNGVEAELQGLSTVLKEVAKGGKTIGEILSTETDTISYYFVAENARVFVYGTDESRKIVAISGSNVYTSDGLAATDAICVAAQGFKTVTTQVAGIDFTVAIWGKTEAEGKTTYTSLAMKQTGYNPGAYAFDVTIVAVDGKGKVETLTCVQNGFAVGVSQDAADFLIGKFGEEGANVTSATIDGLYDANKTSFSGGTQSSNIITAAVKAALAEFDAAIAE